MTPSGIEAGPNVTETRPMTGVPTAGAALERPAVTPDCNEWNEALDAARAAIEAMRHLALIAQNALGNGDLQRAWTAVRDLCDATAIGGNPRRTARES